MAGDQRVRRALRPEIWERCHAANRAR
jgi:hypothetical protein